MFISTMSGQAWSRHDTFTLIAGALDVCVCFWCVKSDLYVSYPQLSLHVIVHHKLSQHAAGGDLSLLNDVGAEGDPTERLILFDHRGNRKSRLGWWEGNIKCV